MPFLARVFLSWGPITDGEFSRAHVGIGITYGLVSGPTSPDRDLLAGAVATAWSSGLAACMTTDMVGLPIHVWYPTVDTGFGVDTSVSTPTGTAALPRLPVVKGACMLWNPVPHSSLRGKRYQGRTILPGIPIAGVSDDTITSTFSLQLHGAWKTIANGLRYTDGVTAIWNVGTWSQQYSPRPYNASTVIYTPQVTPTVGKRVATQRRRRPIKHFIGFPCIGYSAPPSLTGQCHCPTNSLLNDATVTLTPAAGPPADISSGGFVPISSDTIDSWSWNAACDSSVQFGVSISVFSAHGNDEFFTGHGTLTVVGGEPAVISSGTINTSGGAPFYDATITLGAGV